MHLKISRHLGTFYLAFFKEPEVKYPISYSQHYTPNKEIFKRKINQCQIQKENITSLIYFKNLDFMIFFPHKISESPNRKNMKSANS